MVLVYFQYPLPYPDLREKTFKSTYLDDLGHFPDVIITRTGEFYFYNEHGGIEFDEYEGAFIFGIKHEGKDYIFEAVFNKGKLVSVCEIKDK